ncbi:iron ABC transporter permease [Bdellovibrionota bacterium FG-1]
MASGNLKKHAFAAMLCLIIAFGLALRLGAVSDLDFSTILQLRVPRTLLALAVGMGLAVAGAALQALFSNPLCEPYTLGISSGSAVGAVLGASLGMPWMVAGLAGTAFVGALGFAMVLYLIALRPGMGNVTILLVGVMLGFLGSSLVTVWVALSDSNGIQAAMVWLWGDLSRARLSGAVFSLASISILVLMIWIRWRELDALLMGEEGALSLGVEVRLLRRQLIVLTSLMIGICVSAAGMIGFIGLIVPNFCRRLVGSLHLALIPICALWGGTTLILADVGARVIARPFELPVGVVTALVGAPVFLAVMLKRRSVGGSV